MYPVSLLLWTKGDGSSPCPFVLSEGIRCIPTLMSKVKARFRDGCNTRQHGRAMYNITHDFTDSCSRRGSKIQEPNCLSRPVRLNG